MVPTRRSRAPLVLRDERPNNRLQRTALRGAAEPERWADQEFLAVARRSCDVRFVAVRLQLKLLGWQCDGELLTSPSGGFWFNRQMLEADMPGVYA